MNRTEKEHNKPSSSAGALRKQLLDGLPVSDRLIQTAGNNTAILEGGEGSPIVLLHGPGESSFWWMHVIPDLVRTHHVIVPDLPGHGASDALINGMDREWVLNWLDQLIQNTCSSPPVLVGHVLGGAIAARYAVKHADRLDRLVLVDSLGLSRFRPAPLFAFRLIRFMLNPNEKTYSRFLPECMYDVSLLHKRMGNKWEPFLDYNLHNAQLPEKKAALRVLMRIVGTPRIPNPDLAGIPVPVTLIWGRYDRANRLGIARKANSRFGWPLYIIENSGDDPKLEQPEDFVQALKLSMEITADDHKFKPVPG